MVALPARSRMMLTLSTRQRFRVLDVVDVANLLLADDRSVEYQILQEREDLLQQDIDAAAAEDHAIALRDEMSVVYGGEL